jgi:8-oxo-dGTP pyrophosphatase MutT (NUDIX family)
LFLPGGGAELGEQPELTVTREVVEELGRRLRILRKLGDAVQVFYAADDNIWYEMKATFFHADLGADARLSAECDVVWVDPRREGARFFHACHTWAACLV